VSAWAEYQNLARHLDDLAHQHDARTSALASGGRATTRAAQDLQPRLDEQRQRLDRLGRIVGRQVGEPPATFTGVTDPAEALRLAHRHLATADQALTEAERRAQRPALLPGFPTGLRNLLVYLGGAVLAAFAQYLLVLYAAHRHLSTPTQLAWSYVGFPAAAWIGGYLVISFWGRPRSGDATVNRSPRLGFLLCFLAMPVAHLLITVW
jgi:hypothetical protein